MTRPLEQIANPHTLAVPADHHDVTETPAWQAARMLRLMATSGDLAAAHQQIAAIAADDHMDPLDVLRCFAQQLAGAAP